MTRKTDRGTKKEAAQDDFGRVWKNEGIFDSACVVLMARLSCPSLPRHILRSQ
jgi:hypothetical protein